LLERLHLLPQFGDIAGRRGGARFSSACSLLAQLGSSFGDAAGLFSMAAIRPVELPHRCGESAAAFCTAATA